MVIFHAVASIMWKWDQLLRETEAFSFTVVYCGSSGSEKVKLSENSELGGVSSPLRSISLQTNSSLPPPADRSLRSHFSPSFKICVFCFFSGLLEKKFHCVHTKFKYKIFSLYNGFLLISWASCSVTWGATLAFSSLATMFPCFESKCLMWKKKTRSYNGHTVLVAPSVYITAVAQLPAAPLSVNTGPISKIVDDSSH